MALATRPKPTIHYKKRQAQHHRHNKGYLKTYWPYLPMLSIFGIGLMISSLWSHAGHVLGAQSNFSTESLLSITNRQRHDDGESSLTVSAQLNAAAQAKANDMVSHNYWMHDTPDGRTPWSFITAAGYSYQEAGENLAYGFSNGASTVAGWMASPEHRTNILNDDYQNVGFGVASSQDYQGNGPSTVVVAEYAAPAAGASATLSNLPTLSVQQPLTLSATELAAQPVSRLSLLMDGRASWSSLLIAALAGAAFAVFVIRHGLSFRRWLKKGETFATSHPLFDVLIVFIFTLGYVLTRPGGVIR